MKRRKGRGGGWGESGERMHQEHDPLFKLKEIPLEAICFGEVRGKRGRVTSVLVGDGLTGLSSEYLTEWPKDIL